MGHPVHRKNLASAGAQELIEEIIEDFASKQRKCPTVEFIEAEKLVKKVKYLWYKPEYKTQLNWSCSEISAPVCLSKGARSISTEIDPTI